MLDDWLWPLLASLGIGVLTFVLSLLYFYYTDRKK